MTLNYYGGENAGAGSQNLPFSLAVRAGDFVYISGQVAVADNGKIVSGGIESQTKTALENVKRALALAGCGLKDIVKVNVWLDDTRDFWTFNGVYSKYFDEAKPARSTVCSKLMIDAKIEIDVVAYLPEK